MAAHARGTSTGTVLWVTSAIDTLAWVLVRDRALLAVRANDKRKFYLPGGKREAGESDVAGLCREVREEVRVELDPMSFSLFTVLDEPADGYEDGRRVHMTVYTATYHGQLSPGAEITELAWLTSAAADCVPPAGQHILRLLRNADRID